VWQCAWQWQCDSGSIWQWQCAWQWQCGSSVKHQASSIKHQASSIKRQVCQASSVQSVKWQCGKQCQVCQEWLWHPRVRLVLLLVNAEALQGRLDRHLVDRQKQGGNNIAGSGSGSSGSGSGNISGRVAVSVAVAVAVVNGRVVRVWQVKEWRGLDGY
jgi:hypothetical protein